MSGSTLGLKWELLYTPADRLRQLQVRRDRTGVLHVIGAADDDTMCRTSQKSRSGPWEGSWARLYTAADLLRTFTVGIDQFGQLHVFGVAADDTIYRTAQVPAKGQWGWEGSWQPFYAAADHLRTLDTAFNDQDLVEVFGVAADNTIYRTAQASVEGEWGWEGSWQPLYSPADHVRRVRAIRNGDGRLEVFGIAADDTVYHTWRNGAWEGSWHFFYTGADHLRTLDAARNDQGLIEVFGVAADDTIYRTSQTDAANWEGSWHQFYGPADRLQQLRAIENHDGRIEVFGIADNRIFHTWQTAGGWNGAWPELHAPAQMHALDVGLNFDGALEVFAIATDGVIHHLRQIAPGKWS
jgi:hypothetical protein